MIFEHVLKRVTYALAISFVCAVGFGGIALLVGVNRMDAFDSAVIGFIQGMESDSLTKVMKMFTWLGTGLPIAVLTVIVGWVLYSALGHRRELLLLGIAMAGSGLLNYLLKLAFQRARPNIHRIMEVNGYSFPSGHSMAAFSLYATIAYLLWRHIPSASGRVILILVSSLFILIIGISRIYLGVHYPSDVIGGYLASGCWVYALVWAYTGFGRASAVTYPGSR
ncbi:phosphatase PAP2 family protein [Paenibacillus hodogayensis]|uniref:Phosphatase PAP2 family protein n=1 Tax=Paenibacillus hodogayensis TaxID=279208 RepID=A0ABV5W4D2_9BACL